MTSKASASTAGTLTSTIHRTPYPAISPLRQELKKAGSTVLVTGGATGIGYAIAQAFSEASAARVIIAGRRESVVQDAVAKLTAIAKQNGSSTQFIGRQTDVADLESTARLWTDLEAEGISVDVLVLNAASISEAATVLDLGVDRVWPDYLINVRALLDNTERFYKQKTAETGGRKYVVNISTAAIHMLSTAAPERPVYGLTKSAGTLAMQQIAKDVLPEAMQIVSFHPGSILTDAARRAGYADFDIPWDDVNLAGHFAVWAASPEAKFLHGRFVWSSWDVEELKSGPVGERIANEPEFLKVGINGL